MSSPEALEKPAAPKVVALPRSRGGTAREFLPAALEILETPASPAGRMIGATLILFFAITVAWSIVGRIDIIATASGKIVPTGRTKTIQPLETGTVSAINVQDGDKVVALTAREVEGAEREQWWDLAVEAYPPYAEYQTKTTRQIPVFVLE